MMNIYNLEKRLKQRDELMNKRKMEVTWDNWKTKNSQRWLNNYMKRLELFIIDVNYCLLQANDNSKNYDCLSAIKKSAARSNSTLHGNDNPGHFVFQSKEKERIQETLDMNNYFTEPINLPVLQHKFRPRDKSKEIQPEMKFAVRSGSISTNNMSRIRLNSSLRSNETNDSVKPKVHLKSTYSLLLKLGFMRQSMDTKESSSIRLYEVIHEETKKEQVNFVSFKDEPKKQVVNSMDKDKKNTVNMITQLIKTKLSKPEMMYSPKLSDISNPMLYAAERILVKSDTIRRKVGEIKPLKLIKLKK